MPRDAAVLQTRRSAALPQLQQGEPLAGIGGQLGVIGGNRAQGLQQQHLQQRFGRNRRLVLRAVAGVQRRAHLLQHFTGPPLDGAPRMVVRPSAPPCGPGKTSGSANADRRERSSPSGENPAAHQAVFQLRVHCRACILSKKESFNTLLGPGSSPSCVPDHTQYERQRA